MLIPGLGESLKKILPGICSNVTLVPDVVNYNALVNCSSILGYFAVYRICFALTCFYFLFMIIMMFVRNSRDPRAKIQNGFWFFKVLILIGLIVGAFYIPNDGTFETVFMYFGIVGGFLFILIQLILLVDFVHSWNESWVEKFENGQKEFYYGLLIFTASFFILTITVAVLGYVFYASVSHETTTRTFLRRFLLYYLLFVESRMWTTYLLHHVQLDIVLDRHHNQLTAKSARIQQHFWHFAVKLRQFVRHVFDVVSYEQQQQ